VCIGCYECCKRRLKCDKTEPQCLKCQKKGISCSGQGLRCRFSSHMAVGPTPATAKPQPLTLTFNAAASQPSSDQPSPTQSEKSFRWVEPGQRVRKDRVRKEQRRNSPDSPTTLRHMDSASSDESTSPSSDESSSEGSTAVMSYPYKISIHPALNGVSSPQTRMMFGHCTSRHSPFRHNS
jgi:hypothetical protein